MAKQAKRITRKDKIEAARLAKIEARKKLKELASEQNGEMKSD